ncbi:hypothetical protein, variant [Saprolegnia diclina VS20]|uniref:Uncharacterized protein n=1 Tax=Saprolegnia diclina (strain VS20) TaxID=1156394 RepID=T0S1A2_SAPDV|nr:hypothetical protein, variant [Saprolegnia diclina VS20]EQC38763.1 hypothetical protein, variant [Saprolegnia diclina VS20]|eukprot:XP_008607587.1 hypothetical protein, variant [Saprolegnia diclina VS20]
METLAKVFATTPGTEEITLQHARLYSLESLLPLLRQFKELRHLDVSQNNLSSLPPEMAQLSRLVALDISHNPFPSIQAVLPVLQQLPSLKSLSITLGSATDESLVMAALPKLRILNAAPLSFGGPPKSYALQPVPSSSSTASNSALPMDHVRNVASIVSVLKSIGDPSPDEALRMSRMFDQQMELVAMSLKQELAAGDHEAATLLHAKFKVLAACASLATQKAGECHPELGLAIQSLTFLHHELMTSYHALVLNLVETGRHEAAVAPGQLQQLLEVAEGLETDLQKSHAALAIEKQRVAQLQDENLRLRHQLGDNRPRSPSIHPHDVAPAATAKPPPPPPPQVRKATPPAVPVVLVKRDKPTRHENNNYTSRPRRPEVVEHSKPPMLPPAVSPTPTTVKNLTLKQLRDMITAIYASKAKHDEMCAANFAPKETMEQHMYTYLNQRFGLQSLIVEYASAIMKGCTRYMKSDADVATFFHVVRNDMDEGFLRLKSKLEETVVALLRAFLRGLHPRKSEGALNQLIQAKLMDQTLLSEDEWHSVIKYMYDAHDCHAIVRLVESQVVQDDNNVKRSLAFSTFRKVYIFIV